MKFWSSRKKTYFDVRKISILVTIILMVGGIRSASAQLNMLFTNDPTVSGYDSSDIWVTILRGQNATNPVTFNYVPAITYVNDTIANPFTWTPATNIVYQTDTNGILTNTMTTAGQGYSQSILLSDIISNGGLRWYSNASSAQVVLSYGSSINSTYVTNQKVTYYTNEAAKAANTLTTNYNQLAFYANGQLAPNNPSDPSYLIPYQNFELTYTGTNTGDQGDITAINYMASLLSISSFASSNATGTPLQTVGFLQSNTTQAAGMLQTFTNTIGPSGYGNTTVSTIVTNANGNVVRVIGPSQFGGLSNGLGTYTNFSDYLGYVQSSSYSNTVLSNSSSYSTVAGGPTSGNGNQTNIKVTFELTNNVIGSSSNGYGLQAVGTVTAVLTSYLNGVAGTVVTNTYSGITYSVPAQFTNGTNVYMTQAAQFIYGGSAGTDNFFVQNEAYTNLTTLLQGGPGAEAFVDGAGSNSWGDVSSQIAGELSAAFAFGLAGSTNTNAAGLVIGNMPSGQWWIASNGVVPFAGAQTNSAYYDIYASLISDASSNRVYGYAYSDRFGGSNSPLINDLSLNGTNVGSWMVTVGAPFAQGTVPEPTTSVLMGIGAAALAFLAARRRRN
jgi:hypothetical protein